MDHDIGSLATGLAGLGQMTPKMVLQPNIGDEGARTDGAFVRFTKLEAPENVINNW